MQRHFGQVGRGVDYIKNAYIWRRWKWSSIPIIHSFKLSYCISPKNKLNNKLNANAMAAFQFSSSFLKC
jgi:hypothetical protein